MPLGSDMLDYGNTKKSVLIKEFYDDFLSNLAKSWTPSPVWDMLPLELKPGIISMLAGKPNPVTFPFTSVSLGVRPPDASPGDGKSLDITLSDEELASGLQYNLTIGMPALVDLITNLVKHVHCASDHEGWRVSLGPGSQDLLYKALFALLSPGDTVLTESPTYPGVTPIFQILNCQIIEVSSDPDGIMPGSFENLLGNWPCDKQKPKLLYTIPVYHIIFTLILLADPFVILKFGSNPTGITTTEKRRVEILRLARKHNFIILEDDPYFHLYFGSEMRPASYFALERTIGGDIGRVLRLDSFSKVLSAGFRFGWVTGPAPLVDAIDLHSSSSTVQASSIVQMLVYKVLSTWGLSGFLTHATRVAEFYRARRDLFEQALRRHMRGLAEWTTPEAGMFYWVKLLLPPSSCSGRQNINGERQGNVEEGDAVPIIRTKAIEKGVLVLPGAYALVDHRSSPFVRISFSLISESDMDEGLKRLASVLREEWAAAKIHGSEK
ncbi:hypothetical protein AMATHDRAFT_1465 [Amanita thiersii Skay4041]|uniref:Aminotransferase class I/classII large domain-containing protein n=1 Tax=Amanita thiersii Skay4041 TaxID=703135 RepID=A0A2A9NZM5_9AGAR|nr:hypothetical protein AMATHDRAFT_1465 [Amanita thiersii Skay4041]